MSSEAADKKAIIVSPQPGDAMELDDDAHTGAAALQSSAGSATSRSTAPATSASASVSVSGSSAPIAGHFADYTFLTLRQMAAARKAARDARDAQMEKLVHHTASSKRKSATASPASSTSAIPKRPSDNRNHTSRAQIAQRLANKQTIAQALESARQLQKEKQAERAAAAANPNHKPPQHPPQPSSKSSRSSQSANGRAAPRAGQSSASLPAWLAGDEAVPLPSFIARGQSLDLVSEKQLRGWVADAVEGWQRMAEEKRRLHGPRQRKFAAVGQNGGPKTAPPSKSKHKPAHTPKPIIPQERKPSIILPPPIIEDTLLSTYTTRHPAPLPTSASLFARCPPASLTDVVRAFDLVSTFRDVLYVGAAREMSLEMFVTGVLCETSGAENQLLNSVMAALVRAVMRNAPATTSSTSTAAAATLQQISDRPFAFQRSIQNDTLALAAEEEEVSEGVVVNALTWQKHLQDWLVDDSLRWIHRKKWRDHRIMSAFLSIDTFYQLALPQRLYVLQLLARIAVRSPYMRFYFATALDTVAAARKQLQAAKAAQVQKQREIEQNSADVAQCICELVDAVCRAKKRERESGQTVHSLQRHTRVWMGLEKDRQAKEWEAKVDECVERWKLRTVSVGCDRHWNRYWLFGGRTDVLIVHHSDEYVKLLSDKDKQLEEDELQRTLAVKREQEEAKGGKEEKVDEQQQRMDVDSGEQKIADDTSTQPTVVKRAAPPRWSAVTDREGLYKLLSWLNPQGIREKALRETLTKVQWTWKEAAGEKVEVAHKGAPGVKEELKAKVEPATTVKQERLVSPRAALPQPLTVNTQAGSAAQSSLLSPKATVPPTPSVSRAWSLGASNPASLLAYDYTSMFELNKHSLRATQVLMSDVDEANHYARCPQCQEQFDKLKELHCPACHSNIDLQPAKEGQGMLEHVSVCRGDDVRKPRINSLYYVDELDRERDQVTVDLDVTIVPTKRLRKKTDESSESDSGEDEDEEEEEAQERERERLEREQESDKPPAMEDEKEPESKDGSNLSQDGTQLASTTDPTSASFSASPTPLTKTKLVTQHRVTPRPTSMTNLSPLLLTFKALVLDIEAAIPVEAVRSRNQAARLSWVEGMKMASSMRAIGRGLSELGRNLRAGWVKGWFNSEAWQQRLRSVQSESGFASCLFEFDRALIYSEDEQAVEEKRQVVREESTKSGKEVESEEEQEENKEGCRICHSTDDPDTMLLCDGCDLEHHTYCLQPPLRTIPKGKWFCPNCRKTAGGKAAAAAGSKKEKAGSKAGSNKGKSSKSAGGSKKAKPAAPALVYKLVEPQLAADYGICKKCHVNDGDPLLCDRCDDAYHLQCAAPPLETVPEGNWYCGPCLEEMKDEEDDKARKRKDKAADDDEEFKIEAEAEAQLQAEDEEDEAEEPDDDADMEDEDDEEEDEEEEEEEEDDEDEEEQKPRKRLIKAAKKDSDTDEEEEDDPNATLEPQAVDNDEEEEAEYDPAAAVDDSTKPPRKKLKPLADVGNSDAEEEEAEASIASASPSPVPASELDMSSSAAADDCCSVCFFSDSTEDNPILYCDGCNQTVHTQCQGLDAVPTGDFHCDRCAAGLAPDTAKHACVLCDMHLSSGAMRQIEAGPQRGRWLHLSCAIFYPNVQFKDIPRRRGIEGVELVPRTLWAGQCLCCSRSAGAKVSCDVCEARMHVPCALASMDCLMHWDVKKRGPVKRCPQHSNRDKQKQEGSKDRR